MKLLIITEEFPPMRGGVADYTRHLGQALAGKGIRTVVLTSAGSGARREGGVEVLREVRSWNAFGMLAVLRKIRRARPDVCNLQYVPYMYSAYGVPLQIAALAAGIRAMGIPLVTTIHEVGGCFRWARPKYWGIVLLQRVIAHALALLSSQIVVVVDLYRAMLGRSGSKIRSIPVGSNIIPVDVPEPERRRLRKAIAPGGETIIATFAGGAWYKAVVVLEAASALIKTRGKEVKVLVLGARGLETPPGGRSLSRIAEELGIDHAVRITGYLEESDVFRRLAVADIFALIDAGPYGGISAKSTVLVAAFAAGLPVVANRGPITDSLFVHDENIFLVDSAGPVELAAALDRLIDDPDGRRRLADGGRETYRQHFTWERIAADYMHALSGQPPDGVGA
ncbi:MAG: glycosyltransferase family 4 protein [Planctomycetota bacterium]|nr:glycosyltransferase family 4 protein [Planctomycetota bacterium]